MQSMTRLFSYREIWLLLGACLFLTLLWLPGFEYATITDTADYAILGRNIWEHGTYTLPTGETVKYLPLYAAVSYPFTHLFGVHWGMKIASLLSGFGVLMGAYLLARERFAKRIAWGTVGALLIHFSFVLMTTFGVADLLFTALALFSMFFFLRAEQNRRAYLFCGLMLGLACLTRYNGFPLLLLFPLLVIFKRTAHLASPSAWIGLSGAALLPVLWLLYRMLSIGSALPTQYMAEQELRSPNLLAALMHNFVYYINPVHNVLPVFLLFGFYGIYRFGRREYVLLLCMLCLFIFPAFWWSLGLRHAFPGFPLLLMFAVAGVLDASTRVRFTGLFWTVIAALLFVTHLPMFCIYTYGACNAWMDRTIGILPPYLGLTQEGLHSEELARVYINTHAETGATVRIVSETEAEALRERYRPDLFVQSGTGTVHCPTYEMIAGKIMDNAVFVTDSIIRPPTSVIQIACPANNGITD